MDIKFKKQFPTRKELEIVSSTRIWKRQDKAARLIQRTWKDYLRWLMIDNAGDVIQLQGWFIGERRRKNVKLKKWMMLHKHHRQVIGGVDCRRFSTCIVGRAPPLASPPGRRTLVTLANLAGLGSICLCCCSLVPPMCPRRTWTWGAGPAMWWASKWARPHLKLALHQRLPHLQVSTITKGTKQILKSKNIRWTSSKKLI